MHHKLLLLIFLFSATAAFSQIKMSDPDFDLNSPYDCSTAFYGNFVSHSTGGNYAPNIDEALVICPDYNQASKISITTGTDNGLIWDVHFSDTLFIYDGPTVQSPILGSFNSDMHPAGFVAQASLEYNPSGCLTIRFKTNGTDQSPGWTGSINCATPPQTFTASTNAYLNGTGTNVADNSNDTSIINICPGPSVLLVANVNFPYSFENTGVGYSQNAGNISYEWEIDGDFVSANDSILLSPLAASGQKITLRVTDMHDVSDAHDIVLKVASTAVFNGITQSEDTICIGDLVTFSGGISSDDTNSFSFTPIVFSTGGLFTNNQQVNLPDGDGVTYTSVLNITQTPGTIFDPMEIPAISVSMEHSYSGDLEIWLTCPNGSSLTLANLFSGPSGSIPGGCPSGPVAIGNDTDISFGPPGTPAWEYHFSAISGTTTLCNAINQTVTNSYGLQAFDTALVYLPDGNSNDLMGCPLQGEWTIHVRDNLGMDDGYIFGWSLEFFATEESYLNFPVSAAWLGDNIQTITDSSIVAMGVTDGTASYTFSITDNFGCVNDTTLSILVIDCTPPILDLPEFELSGDFYPNPTNSVLNYSGIELIESISVIDFSGRILGTYGSFPIDLSELPSGMYQLSANTEKGIFVRKIRKE